MTVQIPNAPMRAKAKRHSSVEYWLYFSLLFTVLLPTTLLKRAAALVGVGEAPSEGVLRQAAAEAHVAASMIFSA